MTEFQGVPEHPTVESQTGPARGRRVRRRGFAVGAVLAAMAAAGGFAAISGSALSMLPTGSVTTTSASAPSVASAPSASAAAIALALATSDAGTGTTVSPPPTWVSPPARTPEPTAAPTPAGGIVICNTPMTTPGGPGPACPPHPCPMATTGGVSSTPMCPAPPPCAEPQATTTGGTAVMPACPRPTPGPTPTPRPTPEPTPRPCFAQPQTTTAVVMPSCPEPPPCYAAGAPAGTQGSGATVATEPRCQPTLVLTNADSGKTINVPAGTRILVRLSGGGTTMWTAPSTSNGSVVTEVSSSHESDGDASGDFTASKPGTADLTSGGGAHCTGSMRCPMYMRLWVVHIHVTSWGGPI